jgi:hypothetical protein
MGTARAVTRASLALGWAFAAVAGAGVARGEDAPARPAREALTRLEAGELGRSDAVVLAQVRVAVPGRAGAPTLARAAVERTLKGAAKGEVTVFVGGPRGADRPTDRALDPWFTGAALGERGGRYVLFLRTSREGSGWSLEGLFPADDEEGREKAQVLEDEIRLAAEPDVARRRGETVAHLLRLVEAERPWSRLHGARELAWLAEKVPGAIDDEALRAIEALHARASEKGVRGALAAAIDRVEPGRSLRPPPAPPAGTEPFPGSDDVPAPRPAADPPPARSPDGPAAPPAPGPAPGAAAGGPVVPAAAPAPAALAAEVPRLREALAAANGPAARLDALTSLARAGKSSVTEDLARHLSDADAVVRERAAVLLGDVLATAALPRVLARFACEDDPAVREALVRAAGLLGDETTVPWVVERGADPALFRAACYALARIRTPAAIGRLTAWRERAAAAVPRDEVTVRLVDYLRGRSFEEAERIAGHPVGPRPTSREGAAVPGGGAAVPEGTGPR